MIFMKNKSIFLFSVNLIILVISYLMMMPAINFMDPSFYVWIIINLAALYITSTIVKFTGTYTLPLLTFKDIIYGKKNPIVILIFLFMIIPFLLSIASSQMLNAKNYANLIQIQDGNFASDIKEISFNQIPIIDRKTAINLADRSMGNISELVSQFKLDYTFSQINIQGKPVRVSPLMYSDLIKWFINSKNGISRFAYVDMTTGNVEMKESKKPIYYSYSDLFLRNITLRLRLNFPTLILGTSQFELDDELNPYWVTPYYTKRINFFGGNDVEGVIVTDASSGQSIKYDSQNTPSWVDRVYDSDLILQQLNYNGKYKGGFINSVFGQKNVTKTTEGYNYLSIGNDIYLYTGITSILADSGNIGFVLVNQRTKETKFYPVSSADEHSAMKSAEGSVQEKQYGATFPILLNLNNEPTYFMSLKDDAGLTKLFALVNAKNYQNVVLSANIDDLISKYKGQVNITEVMEKEIEIKNLINLNKDGNSIFMILDQDEKIYRLNIADNLEYSFLKIGDKLKIKYNIIDDKFNLISEIIQ